MTTRHLDPAPSATPQPADNWWHGLDGRPGEILWDAHPADLANDLALFARAFGATLPVIDTAWFSILDPNGRTSPLPVAAWLPAENFDHRGCQRTPLRARM